jgi:hypothetical protein
MLISFSAFLASAQLVFSSPNLSLNKDYSAMVGPQPQIRGWPNLAGQAELL